MITKHRSSAGSTGAGHKCCCMVMAASVCAALLLACASDGAREVAVPAAAVNGEVENSGAGRDWYNLPVLRTVWGDFDPLPSVIVPDGGELEGLLVRGGYLVRGPGACGVCHGRTAADPDSPLSGGRKMADRFGEVNAANITPDASTGIGTWSIADIKRALRASINKQGQALSVDVHEGYRWMSDGDSTAVALYLLAQPPVNSPVDRRVLGGFSRKNWGIISQHDDIAGYVPGLPEKPVAQYGRYLARNVAGCVVCHSPSGAASAQGKAFTGRRQKRSLIGALAALFQLLQGKPADMEQTAALLSEEGRAEFEQRRDEQKNREEQSLLGHAAYGVSSADSSSANEAQEVFPPNAPDIRAGSEEGGLYEWSVQDILHYLTTGQTRDGRQAKPELCPWPDFARASDQDKPAIAEVLKTQ